MIANELSSGNGVMQVNWSPRLGLTKGTVTGMPSASNKTWKIYKLKQVQVFR